MASTISELLDKRSKTWDKKKKKKKAARRTYASAAGGANRPTAPATTTAAATSFHSGASSRSAHPARSPLRLAGVSYSVSGLGRACWARQSGKTLRSGKTLHLRSWSQMQWGDYPQLTLRPTTSTFLFPISSISCEGATPGIFVVLCFVDCFN